MFLSPKVVTRNLRWISSKFGCLQVPVGALDATVCAAIVIPPGVAGVAGDCDALIPWRLKASADKQG